MERVETLTNHGAHVSVMMNEAIEALNVTPIGYYVDATFGRGGHAKAIAARLKEGRLLVIDKDPEAIRVAKTLQEQGAPVEIRQGSFKYLKSYVSDLGWQQIDGVLFDLGVSSPQLDEADRGFSFMKEGPLDMRMDTTQGQTAAQWLNSAEEKDIAKVIKEYGEERFAKRIARKICDVRQTAAIETTQQLVDVIDKAIPFKEKNKHFATRTFQAIRIFINQELEDLRSGLTQAIELLKTGGRLVVISFHSLEDRLVKQLLKEASQGVIPHSIIPFRGERPPGIIRLLGKMKPTDFETIHNTRARSAILRVAAKC